MQSYSLSYEIEGEPTAKSTITDDLNLAVKGFYTETPPEQLKSQRRKAIVAILQKRFPASSPNSPRISKQNDPLTFAIKDCYTTKLQGEEINDSAWQAFISILNNSHLADVKKSAIDLYLFRLLRYELEMLNPEKSPLHNDLDNVIESINKAESLNATDPKNIMLQLVKLLYIDQDNNTTRVTSIQQLAPAINALIKAELFTKMNFIRLLLVPAHKNQVSSFYLPLPFHTEILNSLVLTLAASNLLNQYNLEVLFKALAIYLDKNISAELAPTIFSNHCTAEIQHLRIDHHNDKFESIVTDFFKEKYLALTEAEKTRVIYAKDDYLEIYVRERLSNHLLLLFNRMLENQILVTETAPSALIIELAETTGTPIDEITDLITSGLNHNVAIADMFIKLYQNSLILENESFLMLLILAENLPEISKCYSLLQEYEICDISPDTWDIIIAIAPYVQAVNALILWLPPEFRVKSNCLPIVENASYAHDLLAVCDFEYKARNIIAAEELLRTLNINLTIKNHLASLKAIYEFLDNTKLGPQIEYMHQLSAINELYPAIAQGLKKGYVTGMQSAAAAMLFTSVLSRAAQLNQFWLTKVASFTDIDQEVRTQFLKHNYHFVPDTNLTALFVGYSILHEAGLLQQSGPVLERHSLYAEQMAGAIVELDRNHLYHDKYISLLELQPQYAKQITSLLINLFNHSHLNNIDLVRFRKLCKPEMSITEVSEMLAFSGQYYQPISIIPQSPNSSEGWDDDFSDEAGNKTKLLSAGDEESLEAGEGFEDDLPTNTTHVSVKISSGSDEDTEEETAEEGDQKFQQVESDEEEATTEEKTETFPLIPKTDKNNSDDRETATSEGKSESYSEPTETTPLIPKVDDNKIDFQDLVQRCRADYNSGGYFSGRFNRTTFLKLVDDGTIDDMRKVHDYMAQNPRSRTTKMYFQLYLEKSPRDPQLKPFLQEYFKDYTFSFFQRSQLVPKLLTKITNMEEIQEHATESCCGKNRTARILSRG